MVEKATTDGSTLTVFIANANNPPKYQLGGLLLSIRINTISTID